MVNDLGRINPEKGNVDDDAWMTLHGCMNIGRNNLFNKCGAKNVPLRS